MVMTYKEYKRMIILSKANNMKLSLNMNHIYFIMGCSREDLKCFADSNREYLYFGRRKNRIAFAYNVKDKLLMYNFNHNGYYNSFSNLVKEYFNDIIPELKISAVIFYYQQYKLNYSYKKMELDDINI